MPLPQSEKGRAHRALLRCSIFSFSLPFPLTISLALNLQKYSTVQADFPTAPLAHQQYPTEATSATPSLAHTLRSLFLFFLTLLRRTTSKKDAFQQDHLGRSPLGPPQRAERLLLPRRVRHCLLYRWRCLQLYVYYSKKYASWSSILTRLLVFRTDVSNDSSTGGSATTTVNGFCAPDLHCASQGAKCDDDESCFSEYTVLPSLRQSD